MSRFELEENMLTAADIMQTKLRSVSPELGLVELERQLLSLGVQGFPVVENGNLVGIVSRSDIVRSRSVARELDGQLSDYYRAFEDPDSADVAAADAAAAARVGDRTDNLRVRDAMVRSVITVVSDRPVREVARRMLDDRIHRLPVVDSSGALVGIVTSLDVVRLVADGRVAEP